MKHRIEWVNGDPDEIFPTRAAAVAALKAAGLHVGGSPRALAWATEADAEDDDGTRAVAEVWPVDDDAAYLFVGGSE